MFLAKTWVFFSLKKLVFFLKMYDKNDTTKDKSINLQFETVYSIFKI